MSTSPSREGRGRTRPGFGLTVAGGTVLGLGVAGRVAIEVFWAGPAGLRAREPFGAWSIGGIAVATSFANALLIPGLALVGIGARRRGRWWYEDAPDRSARRRDRTLGWTLLGSGLSLWAVTRAAALPVLRACETNGCAYGYLETTYWLAVGAAIPGVVLAARSAGTHAAKRRVAVTPMLGRGPRGLAIGGRF